MLPLPQKNRDMPLKGSKKLESLKEAVELKFGRKPKFPSEFEMLSSAIWQECHLSISSTTLKRVWGYIEADRSPSHFTLDALCSYAGTRDWEHFLSSLNADGRRPSGFFSEDVIYSKDLKLGDIIDARWNPDRHCQFEYHGDDMFTVILSENAKLDMGDSFTCFAFRQGQPLYLDCVQHSGRSLLYVAGQWCGVFYCVVPCR